MGRPSTYDPAYCEQAEAFLKDGFSLTAFAGEIGVSRATIYTWMEEHPEFLDTVKRGQAGAVLWWEKANRSLAITGQGNATACIFGLKNRASEDWRDISRQEHTGAEGSPIQTVQRIERVIIDPANPDAA